MVNMPKYKEMWQESVREIERLKAALGSDGQIVDLAGIAWHMHVGRFTPQQWKQRDFLPPVDFPDIREPLWYVSTIRDKFARPSGRLWCDRPTSMHAVACETPHNVAVTQEEQT